MPERWRSKVQWNSFSAIQYLQTPRLISPDAFQTSSIENKEHKMKYKIKTLGMVALAVALSLSAPVNAQEKSILVQSTTSTQNSGLYEYLLPKFEEKTGIKVNVVAVGTGQAIKNAQNCDADVLLVHAKASEEKFV